MKTQDQIIDQYGLDREGIRRRAAALVAETRAYRLREMRDQQALTQTDVARVMDVGQSAVSQIESGDVERAKVATLRKYVRALGGELTVEAVFGDVRLTVA